MLMSAIRRLREKWRVRRERKKRLNAARTESHGKTDRFREGGW
jgi:hypothetical protein